MNCNHSAKRRATRNTDDTRLRQRIAQIALQRRTSHSQAPRQQARQAARAAIGSPTGSIAAHHLHHERRSNPAPPALPTRTHHDATPATTANPIPTHASWRPPRLTAPRASTNISTARAMCCVPHNHSDHGMTTLGIRCAMRARAGCRKLSATTVAYSFGPLASTNTSGGAPQYLPIDTCRPHDAIGRSMITEPRPRQQLRYQMPEPAT